MGFSSALLSLAALALARGAVAPRRTVPAGRVRAASAASPRPRYDKTPAELFEKAFAPYYIPPTVANARPDLVQKYQPESLSKVRGGRAKIRPKRMVVYVDGAKRYQRPPAGQWRRVAVAPKPVAPVEPKSTDADYYWKQAPIHNWGNTGFRGRMHAFLSPLATAIIDRTSYGGRDVRHEILKQIKGDGAVLDLCCGTGFSTAPGAVGVDATEEMVDVARFWCAPQPSPESAVGREAVGEPVSARRRHPGKLFRVGNAESYGEPFSFDVVTVMFATHEMPQAAPSFRDTSEHFR